MVGRLVKMQVEMQVAGLKCRFKYGFRVAKGWGFLLRLLFIGTRAGFDTSTSLKGDCRASTLFPSLARNDRSAGGSFSSIRVQVLTHALRCTGIAARQP